LVFPLPVVIIDETCMYSLFDVRKLCESRGSGFRRYAAMSPGITGVRERCCTDSEVNDWAGRTEGYCDEGGSFEEGEGGTVAGACASCCARYGWRLAGSLMWTVLYGCSRLQQRFSEGAKRKMNRVLEMIFDSQHL
jgi:hypothetical protein